MFKRNVCSSYHDHSQAMVNHGTIFANFENLKISPKVALNFRKSQVILGYNFTVSKVVSKTP